MKRVLALILCLTLTVIISFPAFAEGDGNMDGGGGSMGGGTGTNYWHEGEDGVRVSIIRISDGVTVKSLIDLSNYNENSVIRSFVKKNKLQYKSSSLIASSTAYNVIKPAIAIPKIISSGGNTNITAIKQYFCSEWALKKIAEWVQLSYDELIGGKYKLLIEPMAYFTFNGYKMAMTATEAALYDQKLSGGLRSKMVSLTHQNLPLSMFLETADLGYSVYTGSTTKAQPDTTIINQLGLGIVKFKEEPTPVSTPSSSTCTYRVNTDVITSVTLETSTQINPNSPARVTFNIGGSSYTVTNIVIPEGDSQVVWVKWHTPSTAQKINISISATKGSLSIGSITADIVSLDNNEPPDPTANDRNDDFTTPSLPSNTQTTSNSWGAWSAVWVPKWVWHEDWHFVRDASSSTGGRWVDKGKYVDEGSWKYTYTGYKAYLSASMNLLPDDKAWSARGKQMKSGYGVKINVTSSLSTTAPAEHYTCAQTGVTYFPEFAYKTYWRHLAMTSNGESSTLTYEPNIYSTYNRGVHFTPLWFPDGKYTVYAYLEDAWTPAGMLSMNLNDYVTIKGSCYDDWHIGPKLTD